jgi:hypothetical protein
LSFFNSFIETPIFFSFLDKLPYITGKELNNYIIGNYKGIRTFSKRGISVDEARNSILKYVVAGKLMVDAVKNKEFKPDSIDLQIAEDRFIQRNMMSIDMTLVGVDLANDPRVIDLLYNDFKRKKQDKINNFIKMLTGEKQITDDYTVSDLCIMETAENAENRRIAAAISDDEIYDWMKTSKFPGNIDDARRMKASEKYRSDIEKEIKDQGIVITKFPVTK